MRMFVCICVIVCVSVCARGAKGENPERAPNPALDLLNFLTDDDGVGFSNLLRAESVIVEGTFVFVGITVKAAVQAAASALES